MLKKYLASTLLILVINLAFGAVVFAETKAEKEAKFAEKVKNNIAKLGIGREARVEVKLKDKTKIKGYISQINENSFVIIEDKTGAATEVPYPNAKQIKGNNLSKGVMFAILGGALIVGLIFAIIASGT